jgi:hypothetical protein
MPMSEDEAQVLVGALEVIGALSLVVGAALKVLNAEIPSFKNRLLKMVSADVSNHDPVFSKLDMERILEGASVLLGLLEDHEPSQ